MIHKDRLAIMPELEIRRKFTGRRKNMITMTRKMINKKMRYEKIKTILSS